ncbi:transposase [Photorhabdus tasmaniensis]|uniref:transposase n=1 Tax=Photorhabdus tasmaniensis TaxID=1004159 RepID=UPI001F62388A|nr:transposase [Photorhabdus tasmaniensis]
MRTEYDPAKDSVGRSPCWKDIGIYTFIEINVITFQHAFNFSIAGLDARLNRRYPMLVRQHMTPSDPLACAIKDVACTQKTTFATTQAVWRFLNNDRIAFSQLNEPIMALARKEMARTPH